MTPIITNYYDFLEKSDFFDTMREIQMGRAHSHFPKLTTKIVYNKGFIKRDFWLTAIAFCISRLHGFKSFFQTCLPKLGLIGSLKNY